MARRWRPPRRPAVRLPFDSTTTAHNPSLLIALIPLAVLIGIGSLVPRANGARIIGALGTLAVVVLFAVQTTYLVDNVPGVSTWDVLDTGFYVAAIAGLVALVSGFLPSGWRRRRWSTRRTRSTTAVAPSADLLARLLRLSQVG